MKNNFNGDTQKKLILSSLLIAALAGPSMFHVSSKTTGSVEMAQTAPASDPAKAAAALVATTAPGTAPAATASLQELQQKLDALKKENDGLRTKDTEREARLKKLEDDLIARKEADEKREKAEKEAAAERDRLAAKAKEAQAKKKIEDDDCNKKEKLADKNECKREQKAAKIEAVKEKLDAEFEESVTAAKDTCADRASRKSDLDQEVLIASCLSGKLGSIVRKHAQKREDGITAKLDQQTVVQVYKENIGNVLTQLMYSDDPESELKAQGLLQSIMGASLPAKLKERVMNDVRVSGYAAAKKVADEFKKLNSPEIRNNKVLRDEQEALANAKRLEVQGLAGNYGSIMGMSLERSSSLDNTSAISYFRSRYMPDMAKILSGLSGLRAGALPADESTRGARGTVEAGVARDSVNRGVVQTGDDQKMRQTGNQGLKHTFESTTSTNNFEAGALRSNSTGTRTGRVRVGTAN